MNGCNGSCCERFVLPFSIHQLKSAYKAWARSKKEYKWKNKTIGIPQDIHLVYPMVIPLEGGKIQSKSPITGERMASNKRLYHYTCKHYNRQKKQCGIYEIRPRVCSRYNYGKACQYNGCNYRGKGCDTSFYKTLNLKEKK